MALDAKTLATFRKKLTKEKKRLEKELKEAKQYPDYGSSDDANAKAIEEFAERLNVRQKIEKLLSEVNVALTKMKQGTYGICENCGEQIELGRLEAYPAAQFCADCAGKRKR